MGLAWVGQGFRLWVKCARAGVAWVEALRHHSARSAGSVSVCLRDGSVVRDVALMGCCCSSIRLCAFGALDFHPVRRVTFVIGLRSVRFDIISVRIAFGQVGPVRIALGKAVMTRWKRHDPVSRRGQRLGCER